MKKLLISFGWVLGFRAGYGQTFSEWWRQKKTQIKYDVQQIAALKAYSETVEKGYRLSRDGLHLISDLKEGDFQLHEDYFNSLLAANVVFKSKDAFADIYQLQMEILENSRIAIHFVESSGEFNVAEIGYMNRVYDNLLDGCEDDLADLQALTGKEAFRLQDQERLRRIDAIHAAMLGRADFTNYFGVVLIRLTLQRREGDVKEVELERMHDLK